MSKHPDTYRQLAAAQPPERPAGISQDDYDAIEDAVMETERGRWFLKEYARRVRAAETAGLLTALERIEGLIAKSGASPAAAASQAEAVVAGDTVERLTGAAEKLLDVVWYMRERGFDSSVCEAVGSEARGIGEVARKLAAQSGIREPEPFERDMIELQAEAAPHAGFSTSTVSPAVVQASPSVNVQDDITWSAKVDIHQQAQRAAQPDLALQAAAFRHIDAMPASRRLSLFV